jgi:hypothetical protein
VRPVDSAPLTIVPWFVPARLLAGRGQRTLNSQGDPGATLGDVVGLAEFGDCLIQLSLDFQAVAQIVAAIASASVYRWVGSRRPRYSYTRSFNNLPGCGRKECRARLADCFGEHVHTHKRFRLPLRTQTPLRTMTQVDAIVRSFEFMRQILLKTAFVIAVTFLALLLSFPAYLLPEALWPSERGGDRLLLGTVVLFACLYAADRIASFLFGRTGLSDTRWSVLSHRTFG